MNGILKIVLSLSLSGSLLILVLLLCKPLFKHKTSKQWQYYIWLVVIARLLLPLAPAVNPVGILFQSIDGGLSQVDTILPSNIAAAPEMAGAYVPSGGGQATTSSPPGQTVLTAVSQNLWLIWLVAALLLLIRKMTLYQDFVHYIKAGRVAVSDPALLDRVAQIGGQAGVKRPVELYTNPLIASPLLIGFFRPCIVLPTTALPESDFQYTILHELTHYKRRDLFYKWLLQLTVCLHWFNPLVYLMSRELNRACELSCDEAVISRLDKAGQRAYGDTLLNAIGLGGIYRASVASVTLHESKALLKERLEAIMKFKKKSRLVASAALILTIFFCTGATVVGAYTRPDTSHSSTKTSHLSRRSESLLRTMEPYRIYGLAYDAEQDVLYYHGQPVKAFIDLKEVYPGGGYSFQVGYFSDHPTSNLYLETTQDEFGMVTGIGVMSESRKNELDDLYDEEDDENPPFIPGQRDEIEDNMDELFDEADPIGGELSGGLEYVVFNATSHVGSDIVATDKFDLLGIPQEISSWISTRKGARAVQVKQTITDGKLDAWVYYDSSKQLAWRMGTTGTTIQLTLVDYDDTPTHDATMIHYQAPATYQGLEVFYQGKKLAVELQ